MISIRKNCFETNSSSMHSLAIWKDVKPYDEYDLSLCTLYHKDKEDGVFELLEHCYSEDDYNFYRAPYRQLKTPIQKLIYVVGYYIRQEYVSGEYLTTFSDADVETELRRLIEKYTGYKEVKWHTESYRYEPDNNGEVCEKVGLDIPSTSLVNDSGEDVMAFVKRKNISLEDLIFKPNYTIQVDGDEYQEFKDMFSFNMINLNNLEDISSGVEYWTDDYIKLCVQSINQEVYAPSDIKESYKEYFIRNVQDVSTIKIEVNSWDALTEDMCEKALELLNSYKDTKTIKIGYFSKHYTNFREKYFQEFER